MGSVLSNKKADNIFVSHFLGVKHIETDSKQYNIFYYYYSYSDVQKCETTLEICISALK